MMSVLQYTSLVSAKFCCCSHCAAFHPKEMTLTPLSETLAFSTGDICPQFIVWKDWIVIWSGGMDCGKNRACDGDNSEALRGSFFRVGRTRTSPQHVHRSPFLPFNFFDPSRRKGTFLAQSIGSPRKCQMRCIERRNDKLSLARVD